MSQQQAKPRRKTVISLSGGMDSTTLLYKILAEGDEVEALHFSYGAKQNANERQIARRLCAKLGVVLHEVDLPFVQSLFRSALLVGGEAIPQGEQDKASLSKTVVPGRNGIFLSILGGFAESVGAERVALANHTGDHVIYPDCRPEWVSAMSLTLFLGSEGKVSVYAPFTHLTKADICLLANKLQVPLAETWSCYEGGSRHCGVCSVCRNRQQAFAEAQVLDPTIYQ